jgi:inhibitor of growth protein 3
LNLPAASSSLRQSSLGPGTPKPLTPSGTAGSVRAGSAGPRASAANKKPLKGTPLAPHQRLTHLLPTKKSSSRSRKGRKGLKTTASDTGEDSALSEVDGSENEGRGGRGVAGGDGQEDVGMGGMEDEDDEGADDKKYCTCRSVSYGNMVACDNEECQYEWFHWSCVGMTREPAGKWYCEECRVKLGIKG